MYHFKQIKSHLESSYFSPLTTKGRQYSLRLGQVHSALGEQGYKLHFREGKRDPDDILPVMLWCIIPFCRQWAASRKCSVYLFLKDRFLDRKSHFAFSLTNKRRNLELRQKSTAQSNVVNSDTCICMCTYIYILYVYIYTHVYSYVNND